MQTVDYSPLSKPKKPIAIFPNAPKVFAIPIVLGFMVMFLAAGLLTFVVLAVVSLVFKWLTIFPWLYFIYWLIASANKRNARLKAQFGMFLQVNGWVDSGPVEDVPFFKQYGFAAVNSLAECSGMVDGLPFSVFQIISTADEKGNSHHQPLRILAVELPREMPTITLFPRFLDMLGAASPFKMQKVSLEGDFDRHMVLRIIEGTQVDVLSYITPDVMDAIKLANFGQVLILSGKYACVTSNNLEFSREAIEPLFTTAQVLIKELKEKQHISLIP